MSLSPPSPLRRSLALITVAGSLAMVYTTCVGSPVATAFFRRLGADDFHLGLIGGLPLMMLLGQFPSAWAAGYMRRRKPVFMALMIATRLLYLPVAFLPWYMGRSSAGQRIGLLVGLLTLSALLANWTYPIWMSWMGDLIPARIFNRYWGRRHRAMILVWTLSYLAITAFALHGERLSVLVVFPTLTVIGVTAGVIDILLFRGVREPANVQIGDTHVGQLLAEPFRNRAYRRLLAFNCAFAATVTIGSAFMMIYTIEGLQQGVWKTSLLWALMGLGEASVASIWGRVADRHGHRPVLLLCIVLKPLVCLLYVGATPTNAFWLLGSWFAFDAMLNAGMTIAVNGYMMKMTPRENRSMYVAALSALSGIAGGLGAIAGGLFLRHTRALALPLPVAGLTWNNYQVLFFMSFLLRIPCILLARRVREPVSARPEEVLSDLLDLRPLRRLGIPLGLYRRIRDAGGRP